VWKVARYTCSSPLYIGECDSYIDGGAVYKNPSIFSFAAIREAYRLQSVPLSGVLSIGDGRMPGMNLGRLDHSNFYSHFYSSCAVREVLVREVLVREVLVREVLVRGNVDKGILQ
jgi:hypothetical protein